MILDFRLEILDGASLLRLTCIVRKEFHSKISVSLQVYQSEEKKTLFNMDIYVQEFLGLGSSGLDHSVWLLGI